VTNREVIHGTTNEYNNYGCRCDECKQANAKAHADYMRRNPRQILLAALYQRQRYWAERYDLAWERKDQDMLLHAQERRDAFTSEIAKVRSGTNEA